MNAIFDKVKYLVTHFTGKKAITIGTTITGIWTVLPDTVSPNVKAVLSVAAATVLVIAWSAEDIAGAKPAAKEPDCGSKIASGEVSK